MTSIRGSLSRHSDELLGKPWKAFAFIDASAPDTPKQLYVKVLFTPRSYAIMATDLTLLWMEDLPEDELEFKFDTSYLSSFGDDARREITKSLGDRLDEQKADTGYRLSRQNENALTLELDYTFRTKIPIKWEFSLRTVSSLAGSSQDPNSTFADRLFHSHVVAPLVILGEEYKKRMQRLEDVIRVKDREISDLLEAIAENRTEGVKRRMDMFSKDKFHSVMVKEFLESSKDTKEMALGLLGVPDKRVAYYEKMPEFNQLQMIVDSQMSACQARRAIEERTSPRPRKGPDKDVPLEAKARDKMTEAEEEAYLKQLADTREAERQAKQAERERKREEKARASKFR